MRTFTKEERDQLKRAAAYRIEQEHGTTPPNGKAPWQPEIISASDLDAKEFPEPRWAVPDLLPEGLALLVGRPKQGKSWMLLGLGLAIAYGGKALGKIDVAQGDVLLLCLEDTERRLKERSTMLRDGQPAPERLHMTTEWRRTDQGGLEHLDAWLTEHDKTRMVGIDVLQRMRPKSTGDGHLYEQDYEIMATLKTLADKHKTLIVAVHHSRKAPAEDPFDQISGTTGLGGGMDTGLVLMRERSQADAVLHVRGRDVQEQELALSFDPRTGQWNCLGDADTYRTTQERLEIVLALREADREMGAKELAFTLGKKEPNIRVLLSKMVKSGEILASSVAGRYLVAPWE